MENSVDLDDSSDDETIDWRKEATAIINDVKKHVKDIRIADKLRTSSFEIYMNLETLESNRHCIRLSASGLQVAGDDFDRTNLLSANPDDIFETPYALLTKVSEKFVSSFATELAKQLEQLPS